MTERLNENENIIIIPAWMKTETATESADARQARRRRKSNFLTRNLRQLRETLLDDLLTERYARQDFWLQSLDPRLKLIGTVLLILLVALTRSIAIFFVLWLITLLVMWSLCLPIWSLQKRIWGIFPMLTLIAAVPAMFSLFNPGAPLLELYRSSQPHHWLGLNLPSHIYISRQGTIAALILFLRVGLSISFGVLLVISTPSARLFKSLRVMRVPVLIVMIMEMSYRYLLLLVQISLEMFEARKLRMVGNIRLRKQQWQVGSSVGALFIKSMELSEEIYQAMTARGYTGEAVSMDER